MRGLMRRGAAILCLWACAAARQAAPAGAETGGARWFGERREDFARAAELSGAPLKIKARFVKTFAPGTRGAAGARRETLFLVEAAGGMIACAIPRGAADAALLGGMKYATPIVISGTVDAKRRVFLARAVLQGWGRRQLDGAD